MQKTVGFILLALSFFYLKSNQVQDIKSADNVTVGYIFPHLNNLSSEQEDIIHTSRFAIHNNTDKPVDIFIYTTQEQHKQIQHTISADIPDYELFNFLFLRSKVEKKKFIKETRNSGPDFLQKALDGIAPTKVASLLPGAYFIVVYSVPALENTIAGYAVLFGTKTFIIDTLASELMNRENKSLFKQAREKLSRDFTKYICSFDYDLDTDATKDTCFAYELLVYEKNYRDIYLNYMQRQGREWRTKMWTSGSAHRTVYADPLDWVEVVGQTSSYYRDKMMPEIV